MMDILSIMPQFDIARKLWHAKKSLNDEGIQV